MVPPRITRSPSSREWAARRVQGAFSISNAPCLGSDFDLASSALRERKGLDFARDLGEYTEHPQTSGKTRCKRSRQLLQERSGRIGVADMMAMLRDHGATTPARRTAHFVSALCVAWPDGHTEDFEAIVEGTLVWPPRGEAGFGYDPMFLPDGHDRTFGEMTSDEKHGLPPHGQGLSHRARAFVKLAEICLEPR